MNRTGFVWHELYAWHDTGNASGFARPNSVAQPYQHLESPESKSRLARLLEATGLLAELTRIPIQPASEEDLLRVHVADYVEKIRALSQLAEGGDAGDGQTPFAQGGFDIATLAAGGAIALFQAISSGELDNGYALVRPPGHHARPEVGMGFCLFANIAIAIRKLQAESLATRVAVLDWDVHHGNGTQEIFYDDDTVLTISIHQDGLFPPESGQMAERGRGRGTGYALNVPLPAGSGNGAYLCTIREVVIPAFEAFRPDLIVVASGFDASAADPLGRMMVTATGYGEMTHLIMDTAADLCDGRVAIVHEGGYSPWYVPYCGQAVIAELCGTTMELADPFSWLWDGLPGQQVTPWQREVIAAAAAHIDAIGGGY